MAGGLDARDLIERTVALIEAGQQHLSLSGTMIALGMEMDVQERGELGRRAAALVSRLGGAEAEPRSHVLAVCGAMSQLWSTHSVHKVRERATGMLLEAVLRKRSDWAAMLAAIEELASQHPAMLLYVRGWARGHFLPGYV